MHMARRTIRDEMRHSTLSASASPPNREQLLPTQSAWDQHNGDRALALSADGAQRRPPRTGTELWRLARIRSRAFRAASNELRARRVLSAVMSFATEDDGEDHPEPAGLFAPVADALVLWRSITRSYMSLLLLAVPLGLTGYALKWDSLLIFVLNFVALVPLALLLGEVTEDRGAGEGGGAAGAGHS